MNIRDYMSQQDEEKNSSTQAPTTESSGEVVASTEPTNGVVSQEAMPKNEVVAPPPIGSAEPYARTHREARQNGLPTGRTLTNQEMYDYLYGSQYDPEKEKKRKKREYTNKVIAAIGDGLGAISNMVTTSAGADNMHNPKNDMLPAMQARYDAMEQRREANKQAALSQKMKARQMDIDEAYKQSQSDKNKAQENYYIRQNQKMDEEQENKLVELENAGKKIDADIKAKEDQLEIAKEKNQETKRYHDELLELQKQKVALQAEANKIRAYIAKTGRIRTENTSTKNTNSNKGVTPSVTVSEQFVGTGKNRRKVGETVTTKKPATSPKPTPKKNKPKGKKLNYKKK